MGGPPKQPFTIWWRWGTQNILRVAHREVCFGGGYIRLGLFCGKQFHIKETNPQTLRPSNPQTLKPSNPQTLKPSDPQTLRPSSLFLYVAVTRMPAVGETRAVDEREPGWIPNGEACPDCLICKGTGCALAGSGVSFQQDEIKRFFLVRAEPGGDLP